MSVIALALALMLTSPDQTVQRPAQDPAAVGPVDLEDIVVEGRRLEESTEEFIREVASPARNRGLARWSGGVCVGVANLQADVAQHIVDRVSTVADGLGLRVGQPGCHPSILVVATTESNAFSRDFVAARPRLFRVGGSGMDQGANALKKFQTTERPVRWWNVSVPVDADTGSIAVRLPGQVNGAATEDGSAVQYAPQIQVRTVSRLTTHIVDESKRSFVIVDVDKIQGVSLEQLADYIAMVSLAQVNPDADTSGYATILNTFDDPAQTRGLTNWDLAYLQGLYEADRTRQNTTSSRTEIASSIMRAHHRITSGEDEIQP